jgi:PAS domain S-box-containing protein
MTNSQKPLPETKIEKNNVQKEDGKYQTLFEQVNAAAFLTTLSGEIQEANQKSCDLLGYTWDELVHITLKDLFLSNYDWDNLIDEISAKGGVNFESEVVKKDKVHVPVNISVSLFTINKKPVMLVLIWDISDRKKAEDKLKASEEKYEGLFECTTDGMLVLDARGEILDVNSKTLEIFGLKEEEMIGKNFLSMGLLTPKALSIVVKQFQELLSSTRSTTYETEIRDKDGNEINVELSSFFLIKKDIEIDNFVLVIRDITERRQVEIKLTREHELLHTLLDVQTDLIYFKDTENKYILVNKAKAGTFNVFPEEMIGKTDFDFLPPDQARKTFEDDEEVINTGKFIINKVDKFTNQDGSEKWISITKIPRFDMEGNIIGILGISRDITEWKGMEVQNK